MAPAETPAPRVLGLLLAGGAGSRMGGADKGLLLLRGAPLAQHVMARLRPQVQSVIISANRHLHAYGALGAAQVLPDDARWQGMGPLAALATLAQNLPDDVEAVQLAPCDTPLLPTHLVRRLLRAAPAYPILPDGAPQPALALVPRTALPAAAAWLESGARSLRGWLASLGARAVPFGQPQAFVNINHPAALQRLESSRHA